MYYYFPQPPSFLLIFGLLAAITSGLAFAETLKQKVQVWSKDPAKRASSQLRDFNLLFPFWSTCAGVCVFLSAGFEIFLLDRWLAYGIALPLTIFCGALVWTQLGQLLEQLEQGGSKALDLDIFR
jgi:hypothetical protein